MTELCSPHQKRVNKFLAGIGRKVPDRPCLPERQLLLTRLLLHLEETFELAEAMGIRITMSSTSRLHPLCVDDLLFSCVENADLVEIADAEADIMVVATGGLSICGIADEPLLQEVDDNNLLKCARGHICPTTGKFLKPADHPRPGVADVLKAQGWEEKS